jgi:hypothetical protein
MNEQDDMTENERYERKALAMIRETPVVAYWALDSRRMLAALRRLIKRGVIRQGVSQYPYWRFEITKRESR